MDNMKDSGVEWIGEIPQSWKVEKIKYVSVLNGRIGWQGLTSEEYLEEGPFLITGTDFVCGGIDWDSCVHISEERWKEANKIQIKNGDLLITKDGTIGKVAIVSGLTQKASLNSGVMRIKHDEETINRYLYYVLISDVFWNWFNFKNSGNSTILHLYQKDFEGFIFPCPSTSEQNSIASFLDDKCKQIDSIISRTEKQIELLKEYKISLITEIIRVGLDDNINVKDGGLDIIGNINNEYKVLRLRYLCDITTGSQDTQDAVDEGIYDFYVRSPKIEKTNKYDYEGEAVLMAGDGVGAGKIFHHAVGKFGAHQRVYIIHNFRKVLPRFLHYYMSYFFSVEVEKGSAKSTVDSIRLPMLRNFNIITPSLIEQQRIVKYLDKKNNQIDTIINKKEKQLEIIKEHKKSLIFEYVTGKRRVEGYHGN